MFSFPSKILVVNGYPSPLQWDSFPNVVIHGKQNVRFFYYYLINKAFKGFYVLNIQSIAFVPFIMPPQYFWNKCNINSKNKNTSFFDQHGANFSWTIDSSTLKPPMNFWNRFNINTKASFLIDGLNYINCQEANFILMLPTTFCEWQNWRPAYYNRLEPTLPVGL